MNIPSTSAELRRTWFILQFNATPPARHRLALAIDGLFEAQPRSEKSSTEQQMGNGQRLLLVEDNAVNQMVAKGMLSRLGFEVDLAEHGEIALSKLAEQDYALVLMDCNMPVMDGYQTMEEIRKHDLPCLVIVVSGDVQAQAREKMLALGALDFIRKPIDNDKLSHILSSYGIYSGETHSSGAKLQKVEEASQTKATASQRVTSTEEKLDACREMVNIAMGRAGEPPAPPLNLVGDYGGGALYLAFGLCAAVSHR